MLSFRWGIFAAVFAFLVSIGLGLISGVNVIHLFLRAFIFAAVFFGIGFGLRFLLDGFFPDLVVDGEESESQYSLEKSDPGESVTIDATGEYAVPELYKSPGEPDELGNIEDLISGIFVPRTEGIDRMEEEGYNEKNIPPDMGFVSAKVPQQEDITFHDMFHDTEINEKFGRQEVKAEQPVFVPGIGDDSGSFGGLVDLDSMAMAFGITPASPASGGYSAEPVSTEYGTADTQSHYVGNKPQPLKGDFDPKELAEGIRTVLAKEK